MLPAVCIVGKSKVGKTSLIEQLVQEFKKRGYKVVAVKHAPEGMDIDMPGKDSWRFAQAGSDAVLVSSAIKLAFVKNTDYDSSIDEILRIVGGGFDLVLMEGFTKGKLPKIEVHRKELGSDLVCPPAALSAVVSDEPLDIDAPQFSLSDTKGIADFIEKNFISRGESDTSLWVNGEWVATNPFVREIIAKVILAMVSTLKGMEKMKNLDISIRNKP
ncbi:MAG: molybdopterin-guanine dinucleotide biosynthesis protein B [Chloroflexi bacterium CG_4_9_14_3_um_filter_45_9]|nr:MAG: molybdopterin-guanine dinucleotide biosynthesis protein B [Chloroflexi bacterium CG_4_9_14_3_um_filter_45_9]